MAEVNAGPGWGVRRVGGGALMRMPQGLRMLNLPAPAGVYSNAQLDDHAHLPRAAFPWRPPLALSLCARFSHPADELRGTAGFGFWNDPFAMTRRRLPALPHAAWFFLAAPPCNIAPALDVPGEGFKAAVMDAAALPLALLLPTAPVALPLMRLRAAERAIWPVAQRVLGAQERLAPGPATAWRAYRLEWRSTGVRFWVDGALLLATPRAPQGPLGLVVWMDNQYLVATRQGRFAAGVVAQPAPQWMEIANLRIEPLQGGTT